MTDEEFSEMRDGEAPEQPATSLDGVSDCRVDDLLYEWMRWATTAGRDRKALITEVERLRTELNLVYRNLAFGMAFENVGESVNQQPTKAKAAT